MKLTKEIQLPNGIKITPNNYEKVHKTIEKDIFLIMFKNRENRFLHSPYKKRIEFYNSVAQGDMDKIYNYLKHPFLVTNKFFNLSLSLFKAKIIASVILLSYSAIDGGVPEDIANAIADCYIKYIEDSASKEYILYLHYHAILEFTSQANSYKRYANLSEAVLFCINFIHKNTHEKITISSLAQQTNLSIRQLSRKFSSEIGCTIATYIQNERIEEAKSLLIFSDYKIIEIASYLSFCSESYFCKLFKNSTGLSPDQFRHIHKNALHSKTS